MIVRKRILASIASIVTTVIFMGFSVKAETLEERLAEAYQSWIPAHTEVGKIKVKSVKVNDKKKTVTITVNEAGYDLSYSAESYEGLKKALAEVLPQSQKNYDIKIIAEKTPVEDLILGQKRMNKAPTEKKPFVVRTWMEEAPKGLDGTNIAVWQSHGWYFEPKLNRWEWQRARIFQTVEDLYTQGYVMPFLMPMLENAGAYVMSPRERDIQPVEIIVDEDGGYAYKEGYKEQNGHNKWKKGGTGFGYKKDVLHNGDNPFKDGSFRQVQSVDRESQQSTVTYSADIPEQGDYAVYVSYATVPKSATKVPYTVHSLRGDQIATVNQSMGGGTWVYLGHFPFAKGVQEIVTLSNVVPGENGIVTADAIKIGGGMGNVARTPAEPLDSIDYVPTLSNYPRFTEGAKYWLQWAGMPDSIYSPSEFVNDYVDDYRSRGLWVNYMSGGSSMNPKEEGLKVPIDLSMAWHTDAGTTLDDSIIGTLSIYSIDKGNPLGNGGSRLASRDLADLVQTQIVEDVRAQYEPDWSRRKLWDREYAECRSPMVPSLLLELLSHQNFADMKYGLDPAFRFSVSRAVYKGMLKYIANRDGVDYVVQPLPVRAFDISHDDSSESDRDFILSWRETVDSLEPTAVPTYYLVEMRVNDGGFKQVAKTQEPRWEFKRAQSDTIYSFRVIAGNDGGISFPSEILSLGLSSKRGEEVTVVNSFTRVSAPDWFEAGEIAGFHDERDHGVPYIQDISFIGSQFEFRREIPWMDDDAAGFGASRANYEKDVIAGNTFDYPYIHGQSILAAGHSFISKSVEAFVDPIVGGTTNKIVDLILGKQKEIPIGRGILGTKYKGFTPELQSAIERHTLEGGSILVTGSYVASDLWDNRYSTPEVMEKDKLFAQEVLGFTWRVGQASVTGEAYQVPIRFKSFTGGEYTFSPELNADSYAVESPDSFYATDSQKGATLMRYTENNLVAATAMDAGTYKTVIIGFPFEVIKDEGSRNSLMEQVLNFFGK